MARNTPRTPEEQRRIEERIAFVQSHPELTKQEARTRFYVQTRASELEAQGKSVDRSALRRKFEMGEVTRQGFYTPSDVQAAQRRRAALGATRTTEGGGFTGTGVTGTGASGQQQGSSPVSDTKETKKTTKPSVRTGRETESWVQPVSAPVKQPEKVKYADEYGYFDPRAIGAPVRPNKTYGTEGITNFIDKAITKSGNALFRPVEKAGKFAMDIVESNQATFINPWINLGGKAIGRNPNLREAGLIEGLANTAFTIADIYTAGASRAAGAGLEALARPTLTAMTKAWLGEVASTAAGYEARNISGRQLTRAATEMTGEGLRAVGQKIVGKIPGGQRAKNVIAKVEEQMTPWSYRQLREGAAKIKPTTGIKPVAEGAAEAATKTRANLAGQVIPKSKQYIEGEFGMPSGSMRGSTPIPKKADLFDVIEDPGALGRVTPAEQQELSSMDEWVRQWRQEVETPTAPAAPKAPEPPAAPKAPEPTAQTTPPVQTGRGTERQITETNRQLKALFDDISESIQESASRVETPTPRPSSGASAAVSPPTPPSAPPAQTGGSLSDLLGPEFEARRKAADEAAAAAQTRRTATRRADLTPEEIEARKIETRAKDAERQRANRARKAEERRLAKEAEAKKAAETQATVTPAAPSEPLSVTEQAREAAGQTPQNWFVTRRQQQEAFRAQQGTPTPAPQTPPVVQSAQETVVEAREAVTRAVDVPAPAPQAPTPAVAPEAPSAPVRPAPTQPTRASDTGRRGTGRSQRPVEQPAAPSRPVETPATPSPTPAPAAASKAMDLSKITTQEQFNDWMNQGGRQVLQGMDPMDLVSTVRQNPNVAGFLEKNPINPPSTPGGKVPGQMKAVSNEGTQTRFNRGGVQIPQELTQPLDFGGPVAKPASLKESQGLGQQISDLEGKLKTLTDLTELRGGARTEVETANIAALKSRIEEVRNTMKQFNEEYIAGVSQKARPMSATEEARLRRMEKSKKAGGTPKETTIDTPAEEVPSGTTPQVESRGTQRRTSDPDWEREVNPDDIDLFDNPSY